MIKVIFLLLVLSALLSAVTAAIPPPEKVLQPTLDGSDEINGSTNGIDLASHNTADKDNVSLDSDVDNTLGNDESNNDGLTEHDESVAFDELDDVLFDDYLEGAIEDDVTDSAGNAFQIDDVYPDIGGGGVQATEHSTSNQATVGDDYDWENLASNDPDSATLETVSHARRKDSPESKLDSEDEAGNGKRRGQRKPASRGPREWRRHAEPETDNTGAHGADGRGLGHAAGLGGG